MEKAIKEAIKNYQCSGCTFGPALSCFQKNDYGDGCSKHLAGTHIFPGVGTILLGMPTGFNRLGPEKDIKPYIFKDYKNSDWDFDKWNIPTWKYLTKEGHTLVRGHQPRKNTTFLHIYLEDCRDKINCLEITHEDVEFMD